MASHELKNTTLPAVNRGERFVDPEALPTVNRGERGRWWAAQRSEVPILGKSLELNRSLILIAHLSASYPTSTSCFVLKATYTLRYPRFTEDSVAL